MDESKFSIPSKIERNKKINYRCPRWAATKMLNGGLIKKTYELKSFQELFDYLVVSGVVYLKPSILEFLKKEMPKYKDKYVQMSLAKFGKTDAPEYDRYMQLQAFMYEQDFHAFNNFCIENNVKPVWVYHCLFVDGFCAEAPEIIDLIKECREKKIRSRKNTVARLVKDKYIDVLSSRDCNSLLAHLTKKFDKKEFDENLLVEFIENENRVKEKETEQQIDDELNSKFDSIKQSREKELEDAVEPILDEGLTKSKKKLGSKHARKDG